MNILITGGSGYVGSALIPKLLEKGYKVVNIDIGWFGNNLPKHKNLKNYKNDYCEIEKIKVGKIDAVIHLASIANDPMALIDKNLSWETSALKTKILLDFMVKKKIKRFIYASSGSVYGISKEKNVSEKNILKPISLYNKVKMVTERVIISYHDKIDYFIIRPATICGLSKRMRLDLTVNALTISALKNKQINVFGGKQVRPNIHIDDMCDVYIFFTKCKKKFKGVYNAGFENKSIIEIAKIVQKKIPSKLKIIKDKTDPRSYRLNSQKLINIGFNPKKNIGFAIEELKQNFLKSNFKFKESFYSLKWLKKKLKTL